MTAEDPSGYQYTVNDCILNFVCLFAFQEEVSFDGFVGETTFLRIIGSGEFWCLHPLCIAAEGEELITLGAGSSMANALGLLLSVYYVFGFDYPAKASNVYFFCEMLIGIAQDARKRIAINKFISAPEVAQNCFQHFRRCEFCWVVITTFYQLMQKSWYQETTQSLANMLL